MGKSRKDLGYFQFPLCLLSMPLPEKELVQVIVSWVLVSKGAKLLDKLPESSGDERLDEIRELDGRTMLDEIIDGMVSTGRLKPEHGFDRRDRRHLAIAMMVRAHPGLKAGDFPYIIRQYERAEAHRKALESVTGRADVEARLRQDIVWSLHRGQISLREFRALAGLYAAIGQKPYSRVSLNRLRYLSAGYRSEAVYQKAAALRAPADTQTPNLPNPPVSLSRQGSDKRKGFFRYYEAFAWWTHLKELGSDAPLIGDGGVFRMVLTNRGALFQIQPHYLDSSGQYVAGRIDPGDVFRPGDQVYAYLTKGRALSARPEKGTVTRTANFKVYVLLQDGEYELTGFSNFITPAALVDEALREWREQHPEESTPAKAPTTLYTDHQLRKTRDKLAQLGFFASYHDGRHVWYSIRMTAEQIAGARLKKAEYKTAAEVKKLTVQAEALERKNKLRAVKEAAKARLAAAKANAPKAAPQRPFVAGSLTLFDPGEEEAA